jgi:hypothetical protein
MRISPLIITTLACAGSWALGNVLAQENQPPLDLQPESSEQVVQTVSVLGAEDEMIGRIDWEKRIVYAVGDGAPPQDAINPAQARLRAKRAAIDEAYARLLETVQEVRVDAESTTRNFVNENRVVQNRVAGLIKNAEIVEQRQFDDGSYQVMMAMPLGGPQGLSATLLPTQVAKIKQSKIISRVTQSQAAEPPAPSQPEAAPAPYSGLIVDAQGLNASPAAFPRIIAQSGDVVYDLTSADPNAATEGLCVYKKSLDAAKQLPRAGDNPLIVKAVDASGSNRVDLVLSDQDAKAVLAANTSKNFLRDALVIVIID